jgi:hypothetical protein
MIPSTRQAPRTRAFLQGPLPTPPLTFFCEELANRLQGDDPAEKKRGSEGRDISGDHIGERRRSGKD